jgi:UDP-N-acetylglucosamine--N-acetylmuramyl-(pentapeptide) pyrophosphoryl-undecaprenol N-acetylglucosamine transferase
VAEALSERGVTVSFAGSPERVEAKLVPEEGYELDPFRTSGFPRELSAGLLRAVAVAAMAPPAAIRILRRRRPDVVLGAGGSVAGPMVVGAGILRIPAALTEADAHLGLANRLASPLAERVFLAYPLDGLDGAKYRVVGRPIPRRSFPPAQGSAEARRRFGLPAEGPVVLVCGGSQGALRLNQAAVGAFGREGPAVLHLAGERDYAELAPRILRPDYVMRAFTDDFGAALAAADLVVSRSGGTVWEIATAGKPALLVPYPYATADHQAKNARHFERGGGAVVVPEQELDLRRQVDDLLREPDRLAAMAESMRALARPDAADVVAEELIALASARG